MSARRFSSVPFFSSIRIKLKRHPCPCIHICIVFELPEERVALATHKDVAPEINCPVVIDFVTDIGAQIAVAV